MAIQFEMSGLIEHESGDVMLQNEQDGFPDRFSCGYPSSFIANLGPWKLVRQVLDVGLLSRILARYRFRPSARVGERGRLWVQGLA